MKMVGMKLRKAEPHEYFDVIYHPLKDATIEDFDRMKLMIRTIQNCIMA